MPILGSLSRPFLMNVEGKERRKGFRKMTEFVSCTWSHQLANSNPVSYLRVYRRMGEFRAKYRMCCEKVQFSFSQSRDLVCLHLHRSRLVKRTEATRFDDDKHYIDSWTRTKGRATGTWLMLFDKVVYRTNERLNGRNEMWGYAVFEDPGDESDNEGSTAAFEA